MLQLACVNLAVVMVISVEAPLGPRHCVADGRQGSWWNGAGVEKCALLTRPHGSSCSQQGSPHNKTQSGYSHVHVQFQRCVFTLQPFTKPAC